MSRPDTIPDWLEPIEREIPDWLEPIDKSWDAEDVDIKELRSFSDYGSVGVDLDESEDLHEEYVGDPKDIKWNFKHFKPQEFASKGDGQVKVKSHLVASLDNARAQFGKPIRITSGYRDKKHNERVGGATNSRHMHGDAVDINIAGYTDEERTLLMQLLRQEGFTAFGSYTRSPNMLHADKRGYKAKWHHGSGGHPEWFKNGLVGKPIIPNQSQTS